MHPPETFVYLNSINRTYNFQGLTLLVMALVIQDRRKAIQLRSHSLIRKVTAQAKLGSAYMENTNQCLLH